MIRYYLLNNNENTTVSKSKYFHERLSWTQHDWSSIKHIKDVFFTTPPPFFTSRRLFYHAQRLRAQQATATTRTARLAAIFEILDGAIVASEVAVPDSVQ